MAAVANGAIGTASTLPVAAVASGRASAVGEGANATILPREDSIWRLEHRNARADWRLAARRSELDERASLRLDGRKKAA